MRMPTETTRRRFSGDDYRRMAEAGLFGPEERVELISGEIYRMSAIGARHLGTVNRMVAVFTRALGERAIVSPQHPVQLGDYDQPQPDLALLAFRSDFYASGIPTAADALLLVEVSDTTLRFDREVKLPLYAWAGIREVWLVDLASESLDVCREPSGRKYTSVVSRRGDDRVSAGALPDLDFAVRDLIGSS